MPTPSDARVQALLEELRRSTLGAEAQEQSVPRRRAARHARISVDRHAGHAVRLPLRKRLVRRLLRWYVEPVFDDQRVVNEALLRLADDLARQVATLEEELAGRPRL